MTDVATPMMVDAPKMSPTDPGYLDTLEEPFQSTCLKALPAVTTPGNAEMSVDAITRLEQLEVNIRSQFLQLFFESSPNPSEIVEQAGTFWTTTVNVCLHMIHGAMHYNNNPRYEKMTPRKLPILLLEDSLDAMSVEQSKQFWERYVEPSLDQPPHLFGELLWKSSNACHLPFLRVCNQFLRVLDTSAHGDQGEWKGRIMTALAKGFSVADRSALKFWGSFHGTTTAFDTEEKFDKTKFATAAANSATKINYTLYESFWSLQADFSNPNRIQVASFIKKIKMVLEAMESAAGHGPSSKSPHPVPADRSIRYMTSSSLLPVQLATPDFRSSVVSQFLITASHLSSESPALANALAPLLTRAKKLLLADAPKLYHLLWETILANREDAWRKWKKDKCPVSAFEPKQSKGKPDTISSPAKNRNKLLMSGSLGNSDGDDGMALAGEEYKTITLDELAEVSKEMQKSIPTLEDHLETYVEALDPESGIEAEYHPGNDSLFAWRAMRLYARHQLPLLKHCRRPEDLERVTREWYIQQGKEIPGEMPPAPPDGDSEEEEEVDHNVEGVEDHVEDDNAVDRPKDEKEEEQDHRPDDDDEASNSQSNDDNRSHSEDLDTKDNTVGDSVAGSQSDAESVGRASAGRQSEQADDMSRDESSKASSKDADDAKVEEREDKKVDNDASGTVAEEDNVTDDNVVQDQNPRSPATVANPARPRDSPREIPREDTINKDEHLDSGKEAAIDDDNDAKKEDWRGGRRRDSSSKRRRSRSQDRERNKIQRLSGRADDDRDRRDRFNSDGGNRGDSRRDDDPNRSRGRNDSRPDFSERVGRRDDGPPRGGRGGAGGGQPPRRDDSPPPPRDGGGARHGSAPPGTPSRSGPPPPRRHDDGLPQGGGSDRRDNRRRGGGGDRRRGRDDSRFRGGRR